MSQLQVWLAIVGGVVLIALVAHSAWSHRQNQPKQADPLLTPDERRALAGEVSSDQAPGFALGIEPVLEPGLGSDVLTSADVHDPDSQGSDRDDSPVPVRVPVKPVILMDALIDVIATMELDAPITGDAALAAMPNTRRVGTKSLMLEGLHVDTGDYEPVRAGERYSAFQMGVQLANRQGPLNDIEFSDFVVKTQAFADAMGTTPEFPDMLEVVSHARELDQFASACDAQLSFNLQAARSAWSTGYVQQSALKLGFIAGSIPGRMVVPSAQPGLPPVLALSYDSRAALEDDPSSVPIRRFSLHLDVPQVAESEVPYQRLCECALQMAKDMEGHVVDDNGQPLDVNAMARIHHELQQLYQQLASRDIAAGSIQARRLFS